VQGNLEAQAPRKAVHERPDPEVPYIREIPETACGKPMPVCTRQEQWKGQRYTPTLAVSSDPHPNTHAYAAGDHCCLGDR
jgi:hypothetical protein